MKSARCAVGSLVALVAAVPTTRAADLHVPGDHPTIQAAIQAALAGDRVVVGPGAWHENIDFLGKEIAVVSSAGPAATRIDGSQLDSVVRFVSGEGAGARLEGFTIRNGKRTASPDNVGGGIRLVNASPTIVGNVIRDNQAGNGAGIHAVGGSPRIEANVIEQNAAAFGMVAGVRLTGGSTGVVVGNVIADNDGGGVELVNSPASVLQNSITGNATCSGGGVSCTFSSALIRGNYIARNSGRCGGGGGGGVRIGGAAQAVLTDNVIVDNTAPWGAGVELFAAGTPTLRNNLIRRNVANRGGGIDLVNNSDALIEGNVIVENRAGQGGGISVLTPAGASGARIVGNTLVGNFGFAGSGVFAEGYDGGLVIADNVIVGFPGQAALQCSPEFHPDLPQIRYNDVYAPSGTAWGGSCPDLTGIDGNLSLDPQFVAPADHDYRLAPSSPCIDAGDPAGPLDADGTRGDVGAHDFDHCEGTSVTCSAVADSSGCVPRIFSTGSPNDSGADDFVVRAENLLNQKSGLFVWSLSPGATPFGAGTLCVGGSVTRAPILSTGGSTTGADCSGTLAFPFTQAYLDAHGIGLYVPVYVQAIYRDPLGVAGVGTTDALRFVRCP